MSAGMIRMMAGGPVDVIGDVHGEIDALLRLVGSMGYASDGSHPEGRRVVFIGDLTDRGPNSVEVARLAMDWVGRGVAECLLGNHELNILRNDPKAGNAWILGPERAEQQPGGEFAHSQVADEAFRQRYVAFVATLPVALERSDLRLVHAAWVSSEIDLLRAVEGPVLPVFQRYESAIVPGLVRDGLQAQADAEEEQYGKALHDRHGKVPLLPGIGRCDARYQMGNPVRVVTSGAERLAKTPFWSAGKWRMCDRVQWWQEYSEDVPVIVGHYWRRFRPIAGSDHAETKPNLFGGVAPTEWLGPKRNVFCVDYSVGARYEERKAWKTAFDTRLMAMRWPERELWGEDGRVY
jgi:hypothetical protein